MVTFPLEFAAVPVCNYAINFQNTHFKNESAEE